MDGGKADPGSRRLGARLLPEISEPAPRVHRGVVEHRRLDDGRGQFQADRVAGSPDTGREHDRPPAGSSAGRSPGRAAAASAVQQMEQRQDGVAPGHPGPGVPHHRLHLLAHPRVEAVDRTVGTGGLVRPERTAFHTPLRVFPQRAAFIAQVGTASVPIPAVEADHHPDGLQLAMDAALCGIQPALCFLRRCVSPKSLSDSPHPDNRGRFSRGDLRPGPGTGRKYPSTGRRFCCGGISRAAKLDL